MSKFITTVLALISVFQSTLACSCISPELMPIDSGCPQRFLAIVEIRSVSLRAGINHYSFKLIADATPSMFARTSIHKFNWIESPVNPAACGVSLQPKKVYLLMGGLKTGAAELLLCGGIFREVAKSIDDIPSDEELQKMMKDVFKERCVRKKPSLF